MQIQQGSNKAIIDWTSFTLSRGEREHVLRLASGGG